MVRKTANASYRVLLIYNIKYTLFTTNAVLLLMGCNINLFLSLLLGFAYEVNSGSQMVFTFSSIFLEVLLNNLSFS